ncbi:hypothetical protein SAMN05444368_1252 [Acetomicrobium flavidum]|uniref:Uncharacterized protein n=1 Tax=Acetomicrobium flavidum TaxID=49896 RepID=A0ABY1JDP6_9BACT|nr:hypothetical protein SAMN05444368_1252 [Acetomicrobium flavidum]
MKGRRAMEEKQNQNQPIQVYENPTSKRIEIHSRHHKLVVRDMKTGRNELERTLPLFILPNCTLY